MMARRKIELDKKTAVALTIAEMPRWKAKVGRFLLALIGLRNVLFISSKDPIHFVEADPKPKPKRKPRKAV